jgi:hypothetical protein
LRTVSVEPMPSLAATERIACQSLAWSGLSTAPEN